MKPKTWVKFLHGMFKGQTLHAWPDEAQRYIDQGIAVAADQDAVAPESQAVPTSVPPFKGKHKK